MHEKASGRPRAGEAFINTRSQEREELQPNHLMRARTVPCHSAQPRLGGHTRGGFSSVLTGSPRRPTHSDARHGSRHSPAFLRLGGGKVAATKPTTPCMQATTQRLIAASVKSHVVVICSSHKSVSLAGVPIDHHRAALQKDVTQCGVFREIR